MRENETNKARATFCYSHVAKCRRGSEGHRSAVTNASAVFSSTTTERPHEFFGYTGSNRRTFAHAGAASLKRLSSSSKEESIQVWRTSRQKTACVARLSAPTP